MVMRCFPCASISRTKGSWPTTLYVVSKAVLLNQAGFWSHDTHLIGTSGPKHLIQWKRKAKTFFK
jgi:hypothetical protein